MILRSLVTRGFRNLADATLACHPSVNLILGDNAEGKTNLLEAIHVLALTRSFRVRGAGPLVRSGASEFLVQGQVDREGLVRTLSVGARVGPVPRRELHVNAEKVSLQRYLRELHVFTYAAALLEVVRGSPDERRRFLDRGIASIHPEYIETATRYQRAIRQRNAALQAVAQKRLKNEALEPWTAEVAQTAARIVLARNEYLARLRGAFAEVMDQFHVAQPGLEIEYVSGGLEDDTTANEQRLAQGLRRDIGASHTTIGCHRDDIALRVRGSPANERLSGGEVKTVVLMLELAKKSLYEQATGGHPLFLLDDVDAELDEGRIRRVLASLASGGQVFVTSPKELRLGVEDLGGHALLRIGEGRVFDRVDRG